MNEGAVSEEATDRQIAAGQQYAWLNDAAPTRPVATALMDHNVGGGAGANGLQTVALAPEVPETDPMNIALIPPTDITPEASVVAYPKPIHTQSHPLNRYPQGSYDQGVMV